MKYLTEEEALRVAERLNELEVPNEPAHQPILKEFMRGKTLVVRFIKNKQAVYLLD